MVKCAESGQDDLWVVVDREASSLPGRWPRCAESFASSELFSSFLHVSFMVDGLGSMVCGLWSVVYGLWCMVYDSWSMVYVLYFHGVMVHGFMVLQFMVNGSRFMIHGL